MMLILLYTLAAGLLAWGTSLIPGSSILLTLLELVMIIHLAKNSHYKLGLRDLFSIGSVIWALSSALKDLVVELFILIWWLDMGMSKAIIAALFVFLLGLILRFYFKHFGNKEIVPPPAA